jgi:lactate dehydrogenase-like 2-hydroxyacid dehydrogenase
MSGAKAEVLVLGPPKKVIVDGLAAAFAVHHIFHPKDVDDAWIAQHGKGLIGIAHAGPPGAVSAALMDKLPNLKFVSSFGVGYDHIDAKHAATRGITVTNTPDVLNEEVADTALGLLLSTVREFPQSERYLRAGKWPSGDYKLTASLRDRTVGMVGLGRIGKAITRRLDAMGVPVVYHTRTKQADVPYRHYANLTEMARDADVLLVITPGGAATKNLINADVLKALGPNGILINMSRGSVVDEAALIQALKDGTILTAGLDVYQGEPEVNPELIAMDHIVMFPHLGSSSQFTRRAMEQLVVDNMLAWHSGKPPMTPVPETPWPPKA